MRPEEYSELNSVTLFYGNLISALRTDGARTSQNRALMSGSTSRRALTRSRELLRNIHRAVTYAESESFSSLISEQPGWTAEQKRLTHVYVRDIMEIQFTSNLDVNRENEPDVNANWRYNRDGIEGITPLHNDNKNATRDKPANFSRNNWRRK